MDFSEKELATLAEFVCGRVDDMNECLSDAAKNPRIIKSFVDGCRKALKELETLDPKLRPFYKKGN